MFFFIGIYNPFNNNKSKHIKTARIESNRRRFFFSQSLCQKQSSVDLLITSNSGLRRHCIRLKMTFCFLQNMLGVLLLRIRSKKRSEENLGFQMAKKTLKYWVATEIVARTKCVLGYVPCFFNRYHKYSIQKQKLIAQSCRRRFSRAASLIAKAS